MVGGVGNSARSAWVRANAMPTRSRVVESVVPSVCLCAFVRTCRAARGRRVPRPGPRARPPRAWRRRATRPSHPTACARVARSGRPPRRRPVVFPLDRAKRKQTARRPTPDQRRSRFWFFRAGGSFPRIGQAVVDARLRSPRDGRAASSRRRRPGRFDPRGPRRKARAPAEQRVSAHAPRDRRLFQQRERET